MKIDIEGVKVTADLADSITARTLKKHIKLIDNRIDDTYYGGFKARGSYYQELCKQREYLVEAYNYFSVEEYE